MHKQSIDKKAKNAKGKLSFWRSFVANSPLTAFSITNLFTVGCLVLTLLALICTLVACSISEEMKHIEASRQYEERQSASSSTDLTGEQIFIRSCNTCHPGGNKGLGPSILNINEKYPEDEMLKALIRKGKGIMPGQPANVIDDIELNRLVAYLRNLK